MAPVDIHSTNMAYVREVLSTAEMISEIPQKYGKPLIATTMRNSMHGIAYELMRERDIPFYEFPEEATRAMYGLYRYSQLQKRSR
jgi:acyl-CoA synthetase (NDP forming)